MRPITSGDLSRLMGEQQPPCVSIYFPTQRSYPDSQQGPIHYRNLLDQAEDALRQKYPAAQMQPLLAPFRALADDHVFWTHRLDGLAVLGSPRSFDAFDLPRPVPERVTVAESFHLKPLLRIVQSADRFHVLCLQRDAVRLYEGNRDQLDAIEPAGVPRSVADALGEAVMVQRKQQAYPGKSSGERRPAPRGPNVPPGHPAQRDDAKLDAERFFRVVDAAVWEQLSRPSRYPLVLAALPEHQAMFRGISRNRYLLQVGIEQGPALSDRELLGEAWKCIEPTYRARLNRFVEDFQVARARQLAADDLEQVAHAIHDGRVGLLLIEADRVIPGRFDEDQGLIRDAADLEADDLLDDLAEVVLRRKGTVVVVPKERMPSTTGLAAILRY